MAKYRLDSIAALARQIEFAPTEVRAAQVQAAELLLHSLEAGKAYPYDFVVFRVTGYARKGEVQSQLLTGLALQHDLAVLIERVSDSLDLRAAGQAEPVLAIDDVTERFNVTSKTIQRWRRKGLVARRFIFPDGKRRVGFLLSSVERFVGSHTEQVATAGNFSQVSEAEKREIYRRARRLAGECRCCTGEITRRIGRKLNRSPLTVLHTIKKHDEERPGEAIFPLAAGAIDEVERQRIVRAHRRGLGIARIARRIGRSRAAVYRVIVEERFAKLNKRKVKFIDDPLYHGGDAEAVVAGLGVGEEISGDGDGVLGGGSPALRAAAKRGGESAWREGRAPKDLPPQLMDLYRAPLLSPGRERALFLKFNFHKYQFVAARRRLDVESARARDLARLEGIFRRATEVKNEIVRANLRLVVSVAKRHLRPGMNLMELVSDGYVTLMRAVESFDVHKGNRFSTYATFALMKGYARSVPAMASKRRGLVGDAEILGAVADRRGGGDVARLLDREHVEQLLSRLDERERSVITAHFGLGGRGAVTLEEVGQRMGLSKQRVRQIEQGAMEKLRASSSSAS